MQEMDNVRVTVEKETYSRDGVHKGMYGWMDLLSRMRQRLLAGQFSTMRREG